MAGRHPDVDGRGRGRLPAAAGRRGPQRGRRPSPAAHALLGGTRRPSRSRSPGSTGPTGCCATCPRDPCTRRQRYLMVGLDLGPHRGSRGGRGRRRRAARHGPPARRPGPGLLRPGRWTGMAAVRRGETVEGFAALDEAMLPVLAGRVDALWAGDIYCTTIHLCEELADLARMRQWTESLARWSIPLSRTFMYAARHPGARAPGDQRRGPTGTSVEAELGPHRGQPGRLPRLAVRRGLVRARRDPATAGRRGGCAGGVRSVARAFGIDPQPGAALLQWAEGDAAGALSALRVSLAGHGRLEPRPPAAGRGRARPGDR